MALDIRTWFAVDGARRRIRTGMSAEQAAQATAHMLDIPPELVLQLATTAEAACAAAREHYRRQASPVTELHDAP